MKLSFQASLPIRLVRSLPKISPSLPLRTARTKVPTAQMKVDAHVHVWDPAFPPHPEHPLPPSLSGTAKDLVENMDVAGVDKTVIVQPINYKFDHSCVADAVKSYPTRFVAVALADTTQSPEDACAQLEHLVINSGFRGVRLNPTFTSAAFEADTVAALMEKAAQLDIPVALFARPHHLRDVTTLLQRFPSTKVLLDHFAFCAPGEGNAAQEEVLAMGRQFEQLYVKTSAWFRVSKETWPHRDLHAYLTSLITAFGPSRLLIGSDYPFVKEQYDYSKAFSLLDEAPISGEDRAWIFGKTAAMLYKL